MSIIKAPATAKNGASPIIKYTGADAKAKMASMSAGQYPELDFGKFLDRRGLDFEIGTYETSAPSGARYGNIDVKVFPKGMDPDSPDTPYILADGPLWKVRGAIEDGVFARDGGYDEKGDRVHILSKAEEYWKESRNPDAILAMTKGLYHEYYEREQDRMRADNNARYEKDSQEARRRDLVAASYAGKTYDIVSHSSVLGSRCEPIDRSDNEKAFYGMLENAFKSRIFSEMESDEPGSLRGESGDIPDESFDIVDDVFESDYAAEKSDMEKAAHALAETIPEDKAIVMLRGGYRYSGPYGNDPYMIVDTSSIIEKEAGGEKRTAIRLNGFNAELISVNKDRDGFDVKPLDKNDIAKMLAHNDHYHGLKVETISGAENDKSASNIGLSLIAIKSEVEGRERYGILKAGMDQNAVMAFLQSLPRSDFEQAFGKITVSSGAMHAETEGDIAELIKSGNAANLYEADLDKGETAVRWFDSAGAIMSAANYETARFEPPFEKYPDKSDAIGKGKVKEADGASESYDEDYSG